MNDLSDSSFWFVLLVSVSADADYLRVQAAGNKAAAAEAEPTGQQAGGSTGKVDENGLAPAGSAIAAATDESFFDEEIAIEDPNPPPRPVSPILEAQVDEIKSLMSGFTLSMAPPGRRDGTAATTKPARAKGKKGFPKARMKPKEDPTAAAAAASAAASVFASDDWDPFNVKAAGSDDANA